MKHNGTVSITFRTIILLIKISPIYFSINILLSLVVNLTPTGLLIINKMLLDSFVQLFCDFSVFKAVAMWLCFSLLGDFGYSLMIELLSYFQAIYSDYINKCTTEKIIDKIEELQLEEFDDPNLYNVLQKSFYESTPRCMSMLNAVTEMFGKLMNLFFAISLLSFTNINLIVVYLISVIPTVLLNIKIFKKWFSLFEERCEKLRFVEVLKTILIKNENLQEIKTYNVTKFLKEKINNIYSTNARENKNVRENFMWKTSLTKLLEQCIAYYVKLKIILFSISTKSTVGTLNMYISFVDTIKNAIFSVLTQLSSFTEDSLYMRSLFEILDMKSVNKTKKISFHGNFKTIELKNVNFKYKTSSEYIIKNFNFTIKQGRIYAISGLNGAGKTTLIKLLLGFYKPNKGQVLINGVDINKYSSESILKNIACVFQPFIKYPLTVKENIKTGICYTDNNLLESIKEAAKMAGASDFIEHLPNQYDTMLQKEWSNGVEISLGQWQKLALARAFFKKASIYILDEATASLDAVAEKSVLDTLKDMKATVIIISHKAEVLNIADEIVTIYNGEIKFTKT